MSKTPINLNGKTILVTGSPGFIGANLVMRLRRELTSGTVISFDNMNDYYDPELKEYRLRMINAIDSPVRHVFIKGSIADKSLVDEVFAIYKPSIVVHGDDWCTGFQKPIRDEVVSVLASYGGRLVEFPYSSDQKYEEIQARTRAELAMPDIRRGRLRKVLETKGLVTAMEAHDGLTGLIVENTVVHQDGGAHQFDAMWVSSLCDSTAKGKPDIELVDMTSRFRTIEDITEVTTKPIIFDGDTGGKTEHFVYTVRSLERLGVSMVIIEDKTGLKKNSLFGTEVMQTQDSIENLKGTR